MSSTKKSARKRALEAEREQIAALYREVFERCMEGETKAFDAKGALSALEQISRMKGLDTPEERNGEDMTLTLSKKVGELGE